MSYYSIISFTLLAARTPSRTLPPANAGREDHGQCRTTSPNRKPALTGAEADRRKALLARLQDELAAQGLQSVLVGRQVLALRDRGPVPPSRRNPELHVSGPGQCHVVTTDGDHYRFADGSSHPADDPGGAAGCVHVRRPSAPDALSPCPLERADGLLAGAGERALRRLRDTGVI